MDAKDRRRAPLRRPPARTQSSRRFARSALRIAPIAVLAFVAVALVWDAHGERPEAMRVAAVATPASVNTTTTSPLAAAPTKAFCDLLRSYVGEVQRMTVALADPVALRPLLDDALASVTQSAPLASAGAVRDVGTLRAVLSDLKSALDAAGGDAAKLRPDAAMGVMSPQFVGSLGRLQALLSEGC